jgi:hypothetical protein
MTPSGRASAPDMFPFHQDLRDAPFAAAEKALTRG